ncbi:hypothetical protein BGZ75_005315 [Mortierella antarctica]|nr:hypothetical protein BGZ75_005315 [Mortierella antarctica]
MSSSSTIAVAGATGTLGAPVTNALLEAGYKVKILTRGTVSNDVLVAYQSKGANIVFDAFTGKNLQNALQGVDILLSTVGTGGDFYNGQVALIDAAKAAGVKRFVASEFGLDAIKYTKHNDLHLFLADKAKLREYIEKSGLEHTYIFNGLFAEYLPAFGFDLKNKTATIHAPSTAQLSITSLADIGRFTALALSSPHSRNAALRVASHTATFQEYAQLFEKATGSKWQIVEDLDARARIAKSADPASQLFPDFVAYAHTRTLFDANDNATIGFQPTPIVEIISAVAKSQS